MTIQMYLKHDGGNMTKYEVTAHYYRAKDNTFTADHEYYIETESTIAPGGLHCHNGQAINHRSTRM